MSSNISRDTFDPSKHYVGVRLQQGVPLVDADWNEMEDIARHELQGFLQRFLGDGVPRESEAFRIRPIEDQLLLRSRMPMLPGVNIDLENSTAAGPLGYGPANNSGFFDVLGTANAPFPLVDGMVLAGTAGGTAFTVTFSAADFADIGRATVAEVVAAVNATSSHRLTAFAGASNDDLTITGGTESKAGYCLVDGWGALIEADLSYTQQALYGDDELASVWGVAPLAPLTAPTASRTDTVYLDVWEREVDDREDPALVNEHIGIPTCVRRKREWIVRVAEGSLSVPVDAPQGHVFYGLANINLDAGGHITSLDDLRTSHSTLSGQGVTVTGSYATGAGIDTIASGDTSLAVGHNTTASGEAAVALGHGTEASGEYATASGEDSVASGSAALAHGTRAEATGNYSTAIGSVVTASGLYATVVGRSSSATGNHATAIGYQARAGAFAATAMGRHANASGDYAFAVGHGARAAHGGAFVWADGAEHAVERFDSTGDNQFLIRARGGVGIGTENPSGYQLNVAGDVYISGTLNGPSVDYAEYFEAADSQEIPLGTTVVIEEGRIRSARNDEQPCGVISAGAMLIGGVYTEWPGKYLRDAFGRVRTQTYQEEAMVPKKQKVMRERQKVLTKTVEETVVRKEVVLEDGKYLRKSIVESGTRHIEEPLFEEVDLYDETGQTVIGRHRVPVMEREEYEEEVLDEDGQPVLEGTGELVIKTRPMLNPDYDETREYTPRQQRPEWNCVGLLGQIPVRKNQPVAANWVKLRELSDAVELWLVR